MAEACHDIACEVILVGLYLETRSNTHDARQTDTADVELAQGFPW